MCGLKGNMHVSTNSGSTLLAQKLHVFFEQQSLLLVQCNFSSTGTYWLVVASKVCMLDLQQELRKYKQNR